MQLTNQYPFFTPTIATYQRREILELSKFDVNERCNVAWFNKAEEYFEIYGSDNDDEKIRHASMKMEGEAYNWYIGGKRRHLLLARKDSKMHSLRGSKVSRKKSSS